MSWNKSFVLIKNPPSLSVEQLLSIVAPKEYRIDRAVYLYETIKYYFDEPDAIFVGEFNSCLVLIHSELTWLMLEKSLGDRAIRIINFFKNSEIVAITENGTSYSFGYALIRNQQRIRLKIGDDGEILEDVGTALDAEKELLADMNKRGQYQELVDENLYEGDSIEKAHQLAQFEVCWRVPNVLFEQYLRQNLDWLSDNLMLTQCLPT
ncbi:MAG: hypothetical protein F6K19_31440 [Cyanothece sp. SIO1E1]|nr:hypothetical protein [Cyanothece sp. SIO1E1]